MGCWQETCAMTHLPIYEDDRCVVVVMSELFNEVLEVNPEVARFKSYEDFKYVEHVYRGKYNDYGWIKGKIKDTMAPDKHGVDRPFSQRRVTVFFHEKVWDEAVKAGMEAAKKWEQQRIKEIESYKKHWAEASKRPFEESTFAEMHKPPTPEQVDFRAVYEVAYWTRRDLMISHYFHGCQSWENEYYDFVHSLTSEMWDKIKKRFDEE